MSGRLSTLTATPVGKLDARPKLCRRCGIEMHGHKPTTRVCIDCRDIEKPIGKHVRAILNREEREHPDAVAAFNAGLVTNHTNRTQEES